MLLHAASQGLALRRTGNTFKWRTTPTVVLGHMTQLPRIGTFTLFAHSTPKQQFGEANYAEVLISDRDAPSNIVNIIITFIMTMMTVVKGNMVKGRRDSINTKAKFLFSNSSSAHRSEPRELCPN